MICFHGLRLYRLAAVEVDTINSPPFGGAVFFSLVRMIELLPAKTKNRFLVFVSMKFLLFGNY